MIYCGEAFSARVRLAKKLLRGTVAEQELERQAREAEEWSLVRGWLEEAHPEIEIPGQGHLLNLMVVRAHRKAVKRHLEK